MEKFKEDIIDLPTKKFAYKYRGKKFIAKLYPIPNDDIKSPVQIVGYSGPDLIVIRVNNYGWKSISKEDKFLIPIKKKNATLHFPLLILK